MTTTMFLFVVIVAAAAATAHAQHLGDTFDDEDNELTSIDVQEGDTVKLECRCVRFAGKNNLNQIVAVFEG